MNQNTNLTNGPRFIILDKIYNFHLFNHNINPNRANNSLARKIHIIIYDHNSAKCILWVYILSFKFVFPLDLATINKEKRIHAQLSTFKEVKEEINHIFLLQMLKIINMNIKLSAKLIL